VIHLKAERDVLRLVAHPGLVNYLGGFQDGACVYFIMEYVSGGEFFRHLKMRGKCACFPLPLSLGSHTPAPSQALPLRPACRQQDGTVSCCLHHKMG
jgi:serine/threonine protein kinase